MFHHKGYTGRYVNDREIGMVHGRVFGLRASITFQGRDVAEARVAFERAVDGYLDRCREVGMEPEVQRAPDSQFTPSPRAYAGAAFSDN